MNVVVNIVLILHIVSGATALLVAPVAMIVKKGATSHRLWGRVFFYAMTCIFITAILLSIYKWIPFLLMIAVFSYYSVFSGYRWIFLKRLGNGQKPHVADWIALIITSTFNMVFIGYGIVLLITGQSSTFALLSIGFGLGGLFVANGNLRVFKKNNDKNRWLYEHLGGMVGGYIAAVTAFSTQAMVFLPGIIQWIWPTILGVPLIAYWTRYYRKQFQEQSVVKSN